MTDRQHGWDTPSERFEWHGHQLDVRHHGVMWQLRTGGQSVETRDLSTAVDTLFGRGRHNFDLVLRILEWDIDATASLEQRAS